MAHRSDQSNDRRSTREQRTRLASEIKSVDFRMESKVDWVRASDVLHTEAHLLATSTAQAAIVHGLTVHDRYLPSSQNSSIVNANDWLPRNSSCINSSRQIDASFFRAVDTASLSYLGALGSMCTLASCTRLSHRANYVLSSHCAYLCK